MDEDTQTHKQGTTKQMLPRTLTQLNLFTERNGVGKTTTAIASSISTINFQLMDN